jgi:hypothetical protein
LFLKFSAKPRPPGSVKKPGERSGTRPHGGAHPAGKTRTASDKVPLTAGDVEAVLQTKERFGFNLGSYRFSMMHRTAEQHSTSDKQQSKQAASSKNEKDTG